jgi:hypothetical protein
MSFRLVAGFFGRGWLVALPGGTPIEPPSVTLPYRTKGG